MSEPVSDHVGAPHDIRLTAGKVVVGVLIGVLWAARRLRQTHFVLDEWTMIERVTQLEKLEGATTSFNGHLWFFQDAIFRTQARMFGLDSNAFLVVMLLVSLIALHLSLTAVSVELGVPLTPALVLGALITYLGPAAQNFVFTLQVSAVFALAAGVGAVAVVLGGPPTTWRFFAVSVLLQSAALFDSGVGLSALVLAGGVVIGLWPRQGWWAIAPAGLITAIWYAFGDLGPAFEASISDRAVFAARLLGRGAGAIGGGAAATGFVVLVVFLSAIVVALRAGRINRVGMVVMLSGGAATLVTIAAIAQSRAGVPEFSFFESNRYLQYVALPLAIMVLPAVVACAGLAQRRWRPLRRAAEPVRHGLPVLVMAVCFVLGSGDEGEYADVFIERSEQVEQGVQDIGVVALSGCPAGTVLNAEARPLENASPAASVRFVAELVDRDLLTIEPRPIEAVDPLLLQAICQP